jgi:hypothetical protein
LTGCALITTVDCKEVQVLASVTVKSYDPAVNPEIVLLAPVPGTKPGLIVQLPAGKPLKSTLPVADAHVGCVIVTTVGADGKALTVTVWSADFGPLQPVAVAVIVLVPNQPAE